MFGAVLLFLCACGGPEPMPAASPQPVAQQPSAIPAPTIPTVAKAPMLVEPEGNPILARAAEEDTWKCTDHPRIRTHEPGACPICGKALVLVEGDDEDCGCDAPK